MAPRRNPSVGNESPEPPEIYHQMMMEMLNTARDWKTDRVQPEDLWDAALRNGFYETLSGNLNLAFEFLNNPALLNPIIQTYNQMKWLVAEGCVLTDLTGRMRV